MTCDEVRSTLGVLLLRSLVVLLVVLQLETEALLACFSTTRTLTALRCTSCAADRNQLQQLTCAGFPGQSTLSQGIFFRPPWPATLDASLVASGH